jgi:hypothetical protein
MNGGKSFKSLFQSTIGQYAHAYTVRITNNHTIQSNGMVYYLNCLLIANRHKTPTDPTPSPQCINIYKLCAS